MERLIVVLAYPGSIPISSWVLVGREEIEPVVIKLRDLTSPVKKQVSLQELKMFLKVMKS